MRPSITFTDDVGKATAALPATTHAAAFDAILAELGRRRWLSNLSAVGHRVAHGGEFIRASVVITAQSHYRHRSLQPSAPLHNPPALLVIRHAIERMPAIPHVAVVDTAFHQTMKPAAYFYALPARFSGGGAGFSKAACSCGPPRAPGRSASSRLSPDGLQPRLAASPGWQPG